MHLYLYKQSSGLWALSVSKSFAWNNTFWMKVPHFKTALQVLNDKTIDMLLKMEVLELFSRQMLLEHVHTIVTVMYFICKDTSVP